MAATNSTQAPATVMQRQKMSSPSEVEKPDEKGGDAVEHDAPHQHALPTEPIGQIAADQAGQPADHHRHEQQKAGPRVELRRARLERPKLHEHGSQDDGLTTIS